MSNKKNDQWQCGTCCTIYTGDKHTCPPKISNCCSAPLEPETTTKNVGRCSKCKEFCEAIFNGM